MKFTSTVASGLTVMLLPISAQAASIVGVINFSSGSGGGVTLQDSGGNETFDRTLAVGIKTWLVPQVDNGDGDFLSVPPGQSVTFTEPWIFNPSTPTSPLWSIATSNFTFTLTSSTIEVQTGNFLLISGTGVLSGDNFENTPAIWSFSSQGVATDGKYSWSSTTEAVPETGTATIVGTILVGACFLRRRRL